MLKDPPPSVANSFSFSLPSSPPRKKGTFAELSQLSALQLALKCAQFSNSISSHREHPASEVIVTGTFDNWSQTEKLHKKGDIFEKEVTLPSAAEKIYYKVRTAHFLPIYSSLRIWQKKSTKQGDCASAFKWFLEATGSQEVSVYHTTVRSAKLARAYKPGTAQVTVLYVCNCTYIQPFFAEVRWLRSICARACRPPWVR